jgi:hypothetical protein
LSLPFSSRLSRNMHDVGEIERGVTTFARGSNGGLIVTGSALGIVHRELIVSACS